ncbi:hypothetical protein FNV43_RR09033 [Rhamnella rubrinervis]|uniref:Uncharacterized protein n=1 Tax=Rhamnella rubrinervis TaxID=2594499 RepID=A0A8K0HAE8_9ROSA|nr:hypothetical protein FNV43_RR09033 [Rhamnella rubrinervis]
MVYCSSSRSLAAVVQSQLTLVILTGWASCFRLKVSFTASFSVYGNKQFTSEYKNFGAFLWSYSDHSFPSKMAPAGMVGVSELLDRIYPVVKKGVVPTKNLAAKEPSALGFESDYKQYYLCLAAAATIKWWYLILFPRFGIPFLNKGDHSPFASGFPNQHPGRYF